MDSVAADSFIDSGQGEPPDTDRNDLERDPLAQAVTATASLYTASGVPRRSLDFVRAKVAALRRENEELLDRVEELESTLRIVQTVVARAAGLDERAVKREVPELQVDASFLSIDHLPRCSVSGKSWPWSVDAQSWAITAATNGEGDEGGWTVEQARKMKEVTLLLMQAKQAKEEALNFTKAGKGQLYEKVRSLKAQLAREREEKLMMKQRLGKVFAQAAEIRKANKDMRERMAGERAQWQRLVRRLKESHMENMQQLRQEIGEQSVHAVERVRQLNQFGERVMSELTELQEHLALVRQGDSVSELAPLVRHKETKEGSSLPPLTSPSKA
ncbi:hypothetical protein FOZ63_012676 [Perkinsus olseni]|uniref:Uncharacterized protein n=2 Tax=Perkinsus olseni TaxID=32597 RepID=A0A7J6TIF3_PEROL|nr:hypothetical protein FOZ63_012676 [Perkinsus olseni]